MLKTYNSGCKYNKNNMDIMASMMLTYTWLKFIGIPLFTMYVDIYKKSNIKVSDPEESML
jgi:hypothetical protein